jgi:penicillin-binding protein 2
MKAKFLNRKHGSRLIDSLSDKKSDPFLIQEGKFDYRNLKDSVYYSDWTEESFLSDTGHKEALSHSFNYRHLRYFIYAFIIGFIILLSRAVWLQIIRTNYYASMAEGNRLRSISVEPKRGIIYSNDLRPLVRNDANFVLYLRPIDLPKDELERDNLLREVADTVSGTNQVSSNGTKNDLTAKNDASEKALLLANGDDVNLVADNPLFYEMKEKLAKIRIGSLESYQPIFVADNLEYEKALLINLKAANWPGVFVTNKIRREYLLPAKNASSSTDISSENALSHILGYTGKISEDELGTLGVDYSLIDYIGKTGLEYLYEKELKGIPGKKNVEVDALGRQKKIINEVVAQNGNSLQLTLDLDLQLKAEEVLRTYLKKGGFSKASFIALDPQSGAILAMVSLPAYNNNLFTGGISQADYKALINNPDLPLLNRAIAGEFPPGSTIKPIFAAGALEENAITENTSFLSTGGLRVGEWFFPDWKAGGHGTINVKQALAWSVNTFFYYIGGGYGDFKGIGVAGLIKYAELFGLGVKSGIDLPGESSGFVPSVSWKEETKNEAWYIGDTYHFAIGQGFVLVTPLQVANYTMALANGGTLYKPHLVANILGDKNEVVREIKPTVLNTNFIKPENLQIVRQGMREAVTYGSARLMNSLPVSSAGKTGTAQWSTKKGPHAWFIGFAPYENPEIAVMVLVEEGVEGSTIAVPVAHDILNWYFSGRPIATP